MGAAAQPLAMLLRTGRHVDCISVGCGGRREADPGIRGGAARYLANIVRSVAGIRRKAIPLPLNFR